MSLKAYQNAWIKSILSEIQPLNLENLSATEQAHLQNWNQAQALQQALYQKVADYVLESVPTTLKKLCKPHQLSPLIHLFLKHQKSIAFHEQGQLEIQLLRFLAETSLAQNSHFGEMCRYEASLKSLSFYQLPVPLPDCPGPVLASWARVIYLGPYFPLLLKSLTTPERQETQEQWPTQPATPYLLLREFKGPRLLPLSPWMAEMLDQCKGQKTWEALIENSLENYPQLNLVAERESLLRAEQAYLKEGILLKRTSA